MMKNSDGNSKFFVRHLPHKTERENIKAIAEKKRKLLNSPGRNAKQIAKQIKNKKIIFLAGNLQEVPSRLNFRQILNAKKTR